MLRFREDELGLPCFWGSLLVSAVDDDPQEICPMLGEQMHDSSHVL